MIDWNAWRADERDCRAYIENPAKLHTVENCQRYDQTAARYIAALEAEIEEMKEYRLALFERMQQLYSAPSVLKITLKRERSSCTGIRYVLTLQKVYYDPGIEPEAVTVTRYDGKDRCKAIAAYRAAVKAHPGILCEMDIAKSKWER